jgi:hypothetical protein
MMNGGRIRIFHRPGTVRLLADMGPLDVGRATARAVLALRLVRGEARAGLEEIINSVWGSPGAATRHSAYHYVSGLWNARNRPLRCTNASV